MLRRNIAVLLIICAISSVLLTFTFKMSGAGGGHSSVVDPDLPEGDLVASLIDKQDYLRRRAEYFTSLRGFEPGERFDPHARGRAITQLDAEQQDLITNLKAAAATAGPNSPERLQLAISSSVWTELGPAPIPEGQTEDIPTPVSGRTTAIAVHPTNPSIAYVGTAQGGLYRTLDGGTTWTPMMDSAQSLAIGAVAFAPSDPSIVYVGTGEANLSGDSFFGIGLYRIDDALGASPVLTGPINPPVTTGIAGTTAFSGVSISKVVVHPTDPATIFVSTASGTSSNPSGGSLNTTVPPVALLGLYRSTNATAANGAIAFQKLTVTTAGGLAPDASGNRSIIDVVMEPGVPNNLICTVLRASGNTPPDGGVYVTANALAGTPTFTRTLALGAATTVDSNQGRAELAINKVASVVTVYVASGEHAAPAGGSMTCGTGGTLRKSVDGGNTWTPPLPGGDGFCAGQCFYDIAVAVDPTNPVAVLLGGSVTANAPTYPCSKLIARSNDGGATFAPTAVGVHADNHTIVFAPSDPTIVYMGTDGGIYKSTNGGNTWTPLNNSTFRATQFQSIATHPTDREIMIGGTQDNGTIKRNSDGTWAWTDGGDGGYALFDRNGTSVTNAIAYHTYQNGGTLLGWSRSTTSGTSWAQRNCPSNGIPCNETVLFYAPIALGPGNPNTFYFGTDRLYRSTDGLVATPVSQQPLATDAVPPATPVNQVLTTIAISPLNDNVRLVGLRNGKVFATTTGSDTLANVTSASFPPPNQGTIRRAVTRAIFQPNDQKTAYITFGGYNVPNGHHIWKTTNLDTSDGAPAVTWTPWGAGIPDVPVNSITIDQLAPENMYAGTDIGVYRSSDGGASWTPFSNGLPRIAIFDLAFQEQAGATDPDRVLRVATHGRGIWEIIVPDAPEVTVSSAVSRKVHGGTPFDVNLPLTGGPGIECREQTGAPGTHQMVITFPSSVTVTDAEVTSGTGTVTNFTPSGTEITVNLTGVSNAQTIVVTLFGVNNVADVNVPMGVLVGDTTASRAVNSSDISQTKSQSGQEVTASNLRQDVTVSGSINSSDISLVKSRSGTALP